MARQDFEKRLKQMEKQILKMAIAHERAAKSTGKHEESLRDLSEGIAKVNKKFDEQAKKVKKSGKGLRNLTGSLATVRSKFLILGFALTQFNKFLGRAIKQSVVTAGTFEALQVRLVGLKGSTEGAKRAFEVLNRVAATTPFTLQGVVEAGANLQAFGMELEDTIKLTADLAAFMGIGIVESANAMGRAFAGGAGAADILRERGILQLIKDFKGIDDLKDTTLPEFREALISTLQDPAAGIAGSTDRLAKTYVGAMSNMQDSITRTSAVMGDLFMPTAKSFIKTIGDMATAIRFKFMSEAEQMLEILEKLNKHPFLRAVLKTKIEIEIEETTFQQQRDAIIKELGGLSKSITSELVGTTGATLDRFLGTIGLLWDNIAGGAVGMGEAFAQNFDPTDNNLLELLTKIDSMIAEIEEKGATLSFIDIKELDQLIDLQALLIDATQSMGNAAVVTDRFGNSINDVSTEIDNMGISSELVGQLLELEAMYKNTDAAKLEDIRSSIALIHELDESGNASEDLRILLEHLVEQEYKLSGAAKDAADAQKILSDAEKQRLKDLAEAQAEALRAEEAIAERRKELNDEIAQSTIDMYAQMFDSLFSYIQISTDSQLNADMQVFEAQKRNVRKTINNESQREAALATIDDNIAAAQKKAHNKNITMQQLATAGSLAATIAEIILNTKINEAKFPTLIPLFETLQATHIATATIASAVGIAGLQTQRLARGGDFVTSGPQMIMVGDNPGGAEHVQVTPLSSPNINGPAGGGNISISFSGNVMSQDFIEDEAIPMIKEAIRRGADIGVA